MSEHVCPWWIGYFLVSPIRRWMQNPDEIIAPYVTPGMTVLEPGPGMGFFTLPLARRVGSGRVIAVDIQPKMLSALRRRATKAGLIQRIDTRLAKSDSLAIDDLRGSVDFVLAVAVVHEMPSADAFFCQTAAALAPGGRLLFAEPAGHVSEEKFAQELEAAALAGLAVKDRPAVKRSHAAVLAREPG
jgi:cyclopropane fatty-acyl-phospholipid synthase-like methyltransferase